MTEILVALALLCAAQTPAQDPSQIKDSDLLTVAEKSNFKATARHREVVELCEKLVKSSPNIRLTELGKSEEGRTLPVLLIADPPVSTPEEAKASGKLIVFAMANIHAGEVCGKEALPMIARDLRKPGQPLLKDMILCFCPIYNADGNERVSKTNRPGQVGPEDGMGIRFNAKNLDLNRDFVKLEAIETRGLIHFLQQWDPHVAIDIHTDNGAYHQYAIMFDGPRSWLAGQPIINYVLDKMMPEITEQMLKNSKLMLFPYGFYNKQKTQWISFPAQPRFGSEYFGVTGRVGILSEAYAYVEYKDRVLATRDFVNEILAYSAKHKDEIKKLVSDHRKFFSTNDPQHPHKIELRSKTAQRGEAVTSHGFVEEKKGDRSVPTTVKKDYTVALMLDNPATLTIDRPFAYLIPRNLRNVVANLRMHGIEVTELAKEMEVATEIQRIDAMKQERVPFQSIRLWTVDTTARKEMRKFPAGTFLMKTAQPLGSFASFLLEPQAEDGLCSWGFFKDMKIGDDFPVVRVLDGSSFANKVKRTNSTPTVESELAAAPPAEELEGPNIQTRRRGGQGAEWLDDDHYLEYINGSLQKVDAETGKSTPFYDPEKMANALTKFAQINDQTAIDLATGPNLSMNSKKSGALFNQSSDLYYATLDGSFATRLTNSKEAEELSTLSPDSKFAAFVKSRDLYAVEVATKKETRLTTSDSPLVSNGKADWVYFEEVYDRNWRGFWWSPDSKNIAFIQYDDRKLPTFTVTDYRPLHLNLEVTAYPKSGDPNPTVKLGIANATNGKVTWVDLSAYANVPNFILLHVAWSPDGSKLFYYITDRAQTWLDVMTVPVAGGTPVKLFRETTLAWIDNPKDPKFLKDGSFLFQSERTGYKHIYHYEANGTLKKQITSGNWEARAIQRVDEKDGWIYFSATKDNPIGENFYRVKIDGGEPESLTKEKGTHRVSVSPTGKYFIDNYSSFTEANQSQLRRGSGAFVRPMNARAGAGLGRFNANGTEMVEIKLKDGFVMHGIITKPPKFDANKKYPVWFVTYAGPHTPTVSDSFMAQGQDRGMAAYGVVVFRADPRSASGKGAASAWTAYKQLGVQELKDIEEAIEWLCQKPYVDKTRIGMSGHSYGGYITAYALTHSKIFAAGIAGAPVTDWSLYDSIYTERFMDTPEKNPEGYAKSSVTKAAKNLHGKLLILHGAMDDNVHMQNTIQFIQALQLANKEFEIMIYPTSRHGIFGRHYSDTIKNFIIKTMKPEQQ